MIHATRHDKGAGCRAVFIEMNQVGKKNGIAFFEAGLPLFTERKRDGIPFESEGAQDAPVVGKNIAPKPFPPEPITVPMTDRYVPEPHMGLFRRENFEPEQSALDRRDPPGFPMIQLMGF